MPLSRVLGTLLFRLHQDCSSLSSLSGEVAVPHWWHNWRLICWHLTSRETVHSSEPVVSNGARPPQGLGFPWNLVSCNSCHIRWGGSPAVCSLGLRLGHVESTASLGFLICKMGITGMGGWGLLLSGIYISLIFEFFKTSIYFPGEIGHLTGLQWVLEMIRCPQCTAGHALSTRGVWLPCSSDPRVAMGNQGLCRGCLLCDFGQVLLPLWLWQI